MKRLIHAQRGPARSMTFLFFLLMTGPFMAQSGGRSTKALVEVRTELGTVVVELFNGTPKHRDNFLELVRSGAYDSLLFHRVIPGLMVQGGDPDSRRAGQEDMLGNGGPGYTLDAEIVQGSIHRRGVLGAVRGPDDVNPERRSNGSQFYIVLGRTYDPDELALVAERNARMGDLVTYTDADKDTYARIGGTPHLDGAYTVFGAVVEGMDVVDAIAVQPCDNRDRPMSEIRMFMRVLE